MSADPIAALREIGAMSRLPSGHEPNARRQMGEVAERALAAHEAGQTAGAAEGWKLVPVRVTKEMSKAGTLAVQELQDDMDAMPGKLVDLRAHAAWNAMLAAAPSPEKGE